MQGNMVRCGRCGLYAFEAVNRPCEPGRPTNVIPEPTRFLDGSPVPPGYLEDVSRMVNVICTMHELYPSAAA